MRERDRERERQRETDTERQTERERERESMHVGEYVNVCVPVLASVGEYMCVWGGRGGGSKETTIPRRSRGSSSS